VLKLLLILGLLFEDPARIAIVFLISHPLAIQILDSRKAHLDPLVAALDVWIVHPEHIAWLRLRLDINVLVRSAHVRHQNLVELSFVLGAAIPWHGAVWERDALGLVAGNLRVGWAVVAIAWIDVAGWLVVGLLGVWVGVGCRGSCYGGRRLWWVVGGRIGL
jgi:hypothetical protein